MSLPLEVAVGILLEPRPELPDFSVAILAGRRGLNRPIRSPHVQKTGLALAGFHEYIRPGRVLVFGESEVRFLESRTPDQRRTLTARLLEHDIPCILSTAGLRPVAELVAACDAVGVRRRAESFLDGSAPDTARFFLEVRGVGSIDVQALYGVSAICATKQIGLVVQR